MVLGFREYIKDTAHDAVAAAVEQIRVKLGDPAEKGWICAASGNGKQRKGNHPVVFASLVITSDSGPHSSMWDTGGDGSSDFDFTFSCGLPRDSCRIQTVFGVCF